MNFAVYTLEFENDLYLPEATPCATCNSTSAQMTNNCTCDYTNSHTCGTAIPYGCQTVRIITLIIRY
jgi:hypothetical protein